MANTTSNDHTPPDCFRLEELETLQTLEGRRLADVNYYVWLNQADPDTAPYRFLYFLELIFDSGESLMLTSGEDSTAICVSNAETLVKTAQILQSMHGKVSIQRINAGNFPLWQPAEGKMLAIRLSKNDAGLYYNDALVLDFEAHSVLVQLSKKEGLEVGVFNVQ